MEVAQILGLLEEGVTKPISCLMKNGMATVVKYPKNQCGTFVLVNEWIGYQIADLIGLTIPKYGLCYLSESVIQNADSVDVLEEINGQNSGLSFYTELLSDTIPFEQSFLNIIENREVERIILFDLLVGDMDRHNGNILCSTNNNKLYIIDCSHIFVPEGYSLNNDLNMNVELSEDKLLDIQLLSNKNQNVYDLLCSRIGYREDVLVSESKRIQVIITDEVLDSIICSIPKEWCGSEQTKRRIDNLGILLKKKFSMIEQITDAVVVERRNGKWKKY